MRVPRRHSRSERSQAGGVTIMVALMLLVFITLTAVGMSRNSFREVVIAGTSRQGTMARNVADSGIEWSIYWMDFTNSASATGPALKLNQLKVALLQNSPLSGQPWDVMSANAASPTRYTPGATKTESLPTVLTPTGTTTTQEFTAGLIRMGKLPIADISQGIGSGAYTPSVGKESQAAPDLWAVRTDAQVRVGGVTFIHAKELWVSTPVQ